MKGILIFNQQTDLVYLYCCRKFTKHVEKLAVQQGLSSSSSTHDENNGRVDMNIIVQLFSPLVTSQRFMKEQFGNPYNTVQCNDGTNILFQDYMGYLFLRIGTEDIAYLKRSIGVCIVLVSYLCGPDVSLLKSSYPYYSKTLDSLISTWEELYNSNESFILEAVEQINLSPQGNSAAIKTLQQINSKLQQQVGNHVNTLLFVGSKLLSWTSTRGSLHLGPVDILFLILLCQNNIEKRKRKLKHVYSTPDSDSDSGGFLSSKEDLSDESEAAEEAEDALQKEGENKLEGLKVEKYCLLFKSEKDFFVPQLIHVVTSNDELHLVIVSELPISTVTSLVATSLHHCLAIHDKSRNPTDDKYYFTQLETSVKKTLDALKKNKNNAYKTELSHRWERVKTGFQTYIKTKDPITFQISPMLDLFREMYRFYFNTNLIQDGPDTDIKAKKHVVEKMKLQIKGLWDLALLNMSGHGKVGRSGNLSMNKYLEEFPGLVHFIYVDRNKHIVTMPVMDYTRDESLHLTKRKVWSMVKFAREHIQQGHFSMMWKDSAFNYSYFLWFEDPVGAPLKPSRSAMPWEGYPLPGIICGDFYKSISSDSFPDSGNTKVRCVELMCIHLGLATSSCVLEHSKRLATNIFDEFSRGNPTSDWL